MGRGWASGAPRTASTVDADAAFITLHVCVAESESTDLVIERDGARILIDDVSLDLLRGSVIDYVEDMIGASFAIRNPQAKSACGCGNSFST